MNSRSSRNASVSLQVVCFTFAALALVSSQPAGAGALIFDNGFEAGHACVWSTVYPAVACPPEFAGLTLAAATGREQITLGWLPAVDDSTAPETMLYRVYLGNCGGPGTLVTTVQGGTGVVLEGLEPATTYCVEVVAEDEDGQTSDLCSGNGDRAPTNGRGLSITTHTYNQVAGAIPLEDAEDLYLGPAEATPTTLTFQRGANAVEPIVGAVLVGPLAGGGGYLRQVDSVTTTVEQIIVETSAAQIETVMQQFELSTISRAATIDNGQMAAQTALQKAWEATMGVPQPRPLVEATTERFSGHVGPLEVMPLEDPRAYRIVARGEKRSDWDHEIGDDLTLNLTLDFEPELKTSATWSLAGVREAEVIGIGTLTLDALAEYHFNASASYSPDPFTLFTTSWVSVYIVGTVPVYQEITFTLEAEVSASAGAEGTATANATATASIEVGARYSAGAGWTPVSDSGVDSNLTANLSVVGGVQAEVKLIPRVSVEFYEAFAAWITVEPSVSTALQAEGTLMTPCLPVQLTQFDADIEVEANVGVDFTLIGSYTLFESTVWDPDPWMLFSLPEVDLGSAGTDPVNLTAVITDGVHNGFDLASVEWWTGESGVELTQDPSDPTMATLTCDQTGTYDVVFSGHGALGAVSRRCIQESVYCTGGGGEITITLPGGVTMDLVYVPAGTFMMGSPTDERGRGLLTEDLHQVTLTQGYFMGLTEVTQAHWEAVTGSPANLTCNVQTHGVGPDYPVYCVSWDEVAGPGGFVDQLNAYLAGTGQPGAGLYRLPTDAEWERAARAENQLRFSHGDVLECDDDCGSCATHDQYMWWCGNDDDDESEPVGSKLANGFGLFDMHGNVWEWVQDYWEDGLGFDPQTDPTGPESGYLHGIRGGGWHSLGFARKCRSAYRGNNTPEEGSAFIGFRLVRFE